MFVALVNLDVFLTLIYYLRRINVITCICLCTNDIENPQCDSVLRTPCAKQMSCLNYTKETNIMKYQQLVCGTSWFPFKDK